MIERHHGVGVAFNLLKIGSSSHTCLLGIGKLIAHLHDLGTVLGEEHGVQRKPHSFSGGVLGHLAQHVFIPWRPPKRSEQVGLECTYQRV
jgi:hypothetical protein